MVKVVRPYFDKKLSLGIVGLGDGLALVVCSVRFRCCTLGAQHS